MTPQHLVALDRANAIRLARADLRQQLHAGTITIADALDAEAAQSMTVVALLTSQLRWGRTKALRVIRHVGCSELRRVSDLTDRQRRIVLLALGLKDAA